MNAHYLIYRSHSGWLLFCLLLIFGVQVSRAQTKPATDERITNIRLTAVAQTSLEIKYDLAVSDPGDSIYFEITGRKSGLLVYSPGFVEGDFGRHVKAGADRRIIWNVIANGYELNEEIRVRVLVKPGPFRPGITDSTRRRPPVSASLMADSLAINDLPRLYRPGGPAMALLSALIPGLGNVFVQSPKPKVGLRPLLTVGVAVAIGYGLNQQRQANGQYKLYEQQKNPAEGEPFFQQANLQHHRFYLATRAAAALWLSDIIFTLVRGIRNQHRQHTASPASLRLSYQTNTPVAAFTLRF